MCPIAIESSHATHFLEVRKATEFLCEPLAIEDYVVQTMNDVSPIKWHLAHTSWYFETFILNPYSRNYRLFDPAYFYLFNSYYNAVGIYPDRSKRGFLTRPTVEEIYKYRHAVDRSICNLLENMSTRLWEEISPVFKLGVNHEQQHQELILTDILHIFSQNPIKPIYRGVKSESNKNVLPLEWLTYPGGVFWMGYEGNGFGYDNEFPRHKLLLEPFQIANRLVTNGEYIEFMEDGGYTRPEFWLSDGWDHVRIHQWRAPLYWDKQEGLWHAMTLGGFREVEKSQPVCHVSFYEADAFARWSGKKLPTEAEWEAAARDCKMEGNFLENGQFHPAALEQHISAPVASQMFGDVWEWTNSPYTAYPGYRPASGALGEYNAKFMCNQMVLRGGSCVTPRTHIRESYRNFFYPSSRWQFSGIRLAREV